MFCFYLGISTIFFFFTLNVHSSVGLPECLQFTSHQCFIILFMLPTFFPLATTADAGIRPYTALGLLFWLFYLLKKKKTFYDKFHKYMLLSLVRGGNICVITSPPPPSFLKRFNCPPWPGLKVKCFFIRATAILFQFINGPIYLTFRCY